MDAKPNRICPLCGDSNACAPAASGSLQTPCWCRVVDVGPEALDRLPEAQRGAACLCARCLGARGNAEATA